MSGESILIIEDERKIARLIQLELEHEGYETEAASTGFSGLEAFKKRAMGLGAPRCHAS